MNEEVKEFDDNDVEVVLNEEDYLQRDSELGSVVAKDTPMKDWLVNYTGDKLKPEDNNVTLEMLINVMAEEFPELLLAVAKENFIRGYQQAFEDVESQISQQQLASEQEVVENPSEGNE